LPDEKYAAVQRQVALSITPFAHPSSELVDLMGNVFSKWPAFLLAQALDPVDRRESWHD